MDVIEALKQFKDAYNNLLEAWMLMDGKDLNDTDAIDKYPFDRSFDELSVNKWVDATVSELSNK